MRNFTLKKMPWKKRAKFILLLLGVVFATEAYAVYPKSNILEESISISGTVTDESGEPMPGVTIIVKGTANGVITDVEGKYALDAPADGVLQFSYLGYQSQEIEINGRAVIDVSLTEDVAALDEVIVTGYMVQKKANVTGATATVKSKDLLKRPAFKTASMLQGRIAGLNIVQNSGQPGDEGLDIRLRGIGSFGSVQPYVLIDGIEGNINAINPADIQDITVLKDAAAAAIYGARASNGVILITTKTGTRGGKPTMEFSSSVSFQEPTRLPDYIYNSVEYMEMWNQGAEHTGVSARYSDDIIDAYRNAAPGDPRYPNFNWIDHMFKTGIQQNHQLSISGGGENNTYFVNLGIQDQEGIIDRYGATRYSARVNMDFDVNKTISMGFKTGLVYQEDTESASESIFEMMLYTYTMPPTMSPYLADGFRALFS